MNSNSKTGFTTSQLAQASYGWGEADDADDDDAEDEDDSGVLSTKCWHEITFPGGSTVRLCGPSPSSDC
ncbi:MAG: hypothetical protein KA313_11390 [Pseudarcicella sp.]|nr:hypothetical protein [Pseudarcicella sp.]